MESPWIVDEDSPPSRRLSSKWHLLLEACFELSMQAWNVQAGANSLTSEAFTGLPKHQAGIRVDYHLRSWFIHVDALATRTDDVINKTTETYIADPAKSKQISEHHQTVVNRRIRQRVRRQRNDYLHARRSWASGVTEDELWENLVSGGMTPAKFLNEFRYPALAADATRGKYDDFIGETTNIHDSVGSILQGLESDLTAST